MIRIVNLTALTIFLCLFAYSCETSDVIDLTVNESGIITTQEVVLKPDNDGILKSYTVTLPKFIAGIYSSQDNYYADWPINGNRILPWHFTPQTLFDIFDKPAYGVDDQVNGVYKVKAMKDRTRFICRYGSFMSLQLENGKFMSILPLSGEKSISWLYADSTGVVKLLVCSHGTEAVEGELPVIAWSVADNIHKACYDLFSMLRADKSIGANFKMRYEKDYPNMFEYLGWCTWEEYNKNINEKLLLAELPKIKNNGLPIRYAIIDDGHLASTEFKQGEKPGLSSFSANEKFPNGFASILKLRDEAGLKWMGLWHNMNGYWGGFSPDNDFGELNDSFQTIKSTGMYMPKDDVESVNAIYNQFLGKAAVDGFDFLKVDWQAANLYLLRNSANAAREAQRTSVALENIAQKYFGNAVINCMAQNNIVLLNTRNTNVTRLSIDYKLNNIFMAKEHLLQSYYNSVFMCPTVWGDHDMFHSSDRVCGEIMALSKAVSGGPIYLSDAPNAMLKEYIIPLCYADGKLLRPLAPAATLQKSVFTSPITEEKLYFVSAPLANNSAVIVAYNLNADTVNINGNISDEDYMQTGMLIQPEVKTWEIPKEGLYVYDYFAKCGRPFDSKYEFSINGFGQKYIILTPIKNGISIIGRADKYLAPAAIRNISYYTDGVSFDMDESGDILVWIKSGRPLAKGVAFTQRGNGLWLGKMEAGSQNNNINISII